MYNGQDNSCGSPFGAICSSAIAPAIPSSQIAPTVLPRLLPDCYTNLNHAIKISFSPYELKLHQGLGGRRGALLRVEFPRGYIGYADCHPWPELGDLPLEQQLEQLRNNQFTPLTERSLFFAETDAKARAFGVNLFAGLSIPISHAFVSGRCLPPEAVQTPYLKIKVGQHDFEEELSFLHALPNFYRLRLDANSRLTMPQFARMAEELRERIDFFEDPLPFDPLIWRHLKSYGVPLALDRRADLWVEEEESYDYLVVKPAIQPLYPTSRPTVITSYLDHPIGQLSAAYVAATAACPLAICGLLSHTAYQPNAFSERLQIKEGRLIPPLVGMGWGFDDLLEATEWYPISNFAN